MTQEGPFSPGDLVVHSTHGVSRYQGIRLLPSDGAMKQYFQLDYAGGDRVFIPVEHADRLAKHDGDDVSLARLAQQAQPRSPYTRASQPPPPVRSAVSPPKDRPGG